MQKDLFLGIDIGSVTIKTALLGADKTLLSETYTRIKGDPLNSLENELQALTSKFPESKIIAAGITGSGGKQVAGTIGSLVHQRDTRSVRLCRPLIIPMRAPSSRWAERMRSSSPLPAMRSLRGSGSKTFP